MGPDMHGEPARTSAPSGSTANSTSGSRIHYPSLFTEKEKDVKATTATAFAWVLSGCAMGDPPPTLLEEQMARDRANRGAQAELEAEFASLSRQRQAEAAVREERTRRQLEEFADSPEACDSFLGQMARMQTGKDRC